MRNAYTILVGKFEEEKLWIDSTILSHVRDYVTNNNGFWIGWLDLLALLLQFLLFTINYSTTANVPTSQITRTRYPSPGNGFVTRTVTSNHYEVFLPFLVQSPWNADPPELDQILLFYFSNPPSSSQSLILPDDQSVSKSWCRAPSGAHDQILITLWQLWSCLCEAPTRTRGRFCLLDMLLVLASVVFLESESLGTVSDLRLPFSSPPTTRRVTVEVFGPASTRTNSSSTNRHSLYSHGTDT
jgi:hypothetical protein